MRTTGLFGLAAILVLGAGTAWAKCDPTADPDKSDIAAARAAVAANCDCAGAASHGAYVKCSADTANGTLVNKSCKGQVQRCAARSTCGKPGFVSCCRTSSKGKLTCSTKSDASKCKAPKKGSACVSQTASCCDACDPNSTPPCSPSGAFLDSSGLF